jgi:hypothetical protein
MAKLATSQPMPRKAPGLHAVRFRHFFEQLVKERGGNASAAAAAIGLKQSFSSMILNGGRNASWDTIRVAREHIPVSHRFFDDPALGDAPDYRDHIESGRGASAARPADAPQARVVPDNAADDSGQGGLTQMQKAVAYEVSRELGAPSARHHEEIDVLVRSVAALAGYDRMLAMVKYAYGQWLKSDKGRLATSLAIKAQAREAEAIAKLEEEQKALESRGIVVQRGPGKKTTR